MYKIIQVVMIGGAVALTSMAGAEAGDRKGNRNTSLLGIDVGVNLGGKKGLKADVDARIGGKKAVDADADVSLGGRKGLKADVDATIGGKNGIKADVDIGLGGKKGLKAKVNAAIGDDVGVDIGLGTKNGKRSTFPGDDEGGNTDSDNASNDDSGNNNGDNPGGALTSAQRQAFNRLSDSDKATLMKRCGGVSAGGYDPALVQLCALLRMSASR